MSDLRDWLRRNKFEQYADAFETNDIDIDILPELTESDGVGFYLPEIYRLRGECLLALHRDNKDEARSAFAIARDIARRQGAVIFERRAEASSERHSVNSIDEPRPS